MVTDAGAGDVRRRLEAALRGREAARVPDGEADRRAAVVVTLRPPGPGGTRPAGGGSGEPGGLASLETLIVLRAEREADPWSGHAGLPGGHREPGDADLVAAALRELAEETGLALPREAVVGRLDEIHPRSRRLPSVAVTPFVAWHPGGETVEPGPEVAGHLWTPLHTLRDPERRSVLTFRREGALRAFPGVDVGGLTVWGLTLAIFRRFLALLPEEEPAGPASRGEAEPDGASDPGGGGEGGAAP